MGLFSKITKPINSMLSPLGLGGEQGDFYSPEQQAANNYANFANNSEAGMGAATTQANRDVAGGVGGQLWGSGGLTDRLNTEEQQLAGQGFNLTPEDHSAYGQASGDISRLFGQQEQQASQSLARRGLGGGASGAAGAAFSGLAGNKNEMLAKAQTDIAQKRMADTQQRLQATRSQLQSLGMGGQQMVNDMAQNNFSNKEGALRSAAGIENNSNNQMKASLDSKNENKGQTLFDAAGQGLFSGVKTGVAKGVSSAGSGLFGGG